MIKSLYPVYRVAYEVYITGPNGETGWKIETGSIASGGSTPRLTAINWLEHNISNFDCIIQVSVIAVIK